MSNHPILLDFDFDQSGFGITLRSGSDPGWSADGAWHQSLSKKEGKAGGAKSCLGRKGNFQGQATVLSIGDFHTSVS